MHGKVKRLVLNRLIVMYKLMFLAMNRIESGVITNTYKLELPPSSCIHPVFHVSCLKEVLGTNIKGQTILPKLDNEGSIFLELEAVLNKRTRQLHSRSITEVLIQWHRMQPEDATWDHSFRFSDNFHI